VRHRAAERHSCNDVNCASAAPVHVVVRPPSSTLISICLSLSF
jgi:hypothetical protein